MVVRACEQLTQGLGIGQLEPGQRHRIQSAAGGVHDQGRQADAALAAIDTAFIAQIETPKGLLDARDIAAASPRLQALMFGGFDYVLEPHYNTNSETKQVLDGVTDAQAALMDSVLMQAAETDAALALMFDSLQDQFEQAQETIRHLSRLNEEYLSRLASRKSAPVLDSAGVAGFVLPRREPAGDLEAMRAFRTAALVPLQALPKAPGQQDTTSPEARMMARRYGIR